MSDKKAEQKVKMLATKKAKADRFNAQTITVNDEWRIRRADELNWEVQYKGKFHGFYGSVSGAVRSLPDKMLGEAAGGTLNDLSGRLRAISDTIERALTGRIV